MVKTEMQNGKTVFTILPFYHFVKNTNRLSKYG